MKNLLVINSLFLCLLLANCTSQGVDGNCVEYKHTTIYSASVPTIGQINQSIPINISFISYSGCGEFGSIEETNQEKIKTIKVIVKYEGCICTAVVKTLLYTYYFKETEKGNYTINFLQPDGTLIAKTITIE